MHISCDKCGGNNTLPEGTTTMFCAYCGNFLKIKIDKKEEKHRESLIKTKPIITNLENRYFRNHKFKEQIERQINYVYVKSDPNYMYLGKLLKIKDRQIYSIKKEVVSWFNDDELQIIAALDLHENCINNLSDIKYFSYIFDIYLSQNKIEEIIDLFKHVPLLRYIDLKNNLINLLDDKFLRSIIGYKNIELDLRGNPIKFVNFLNSTVKKFDMNLSVESYINTVKIDQNASELLQFYKLNDEPGGFKPTCNDYTYYFYNFLDDISILKQKIKNRSVSDKKHEYKKIIGTFDYFYHALIKPFEIKIYIDKKTTIQSLGSFKIQEDSSGFYLILKGEKPTKEDFINYINDPFLNKILNSKVAKRKGWSLD